MAQPKPRPKSSTLMSLLKNILSSGGQTMAQSAQGMSGAGLVKSGGQAMLNRMAENLDPFDYSIGPTRSWAERGMDAILLNRKEPSRAETERYLETGSGQIASPTFKSRMDLLQMLANKPQKYGMIKESEYRPTIGGESGKYYSSREIENEIISDLGLGDKSIKWQKDIANIISEKGKVNPKNPRLVNAIIPGLGVANYSVGKDDKGVYLAYSDLWDIDPREGGYADEKKASTTTLEDLVSMGTGTAINLMKTAANPTKVYGRIYFDPKTGKPIR